MAFFNVSIEGAESLDQDLQKEVEKIKKKIPFALQNVGYEMIESLHLHIQNDFYDAYEPQKYQRRGELGSDENMELEFSMDEQAISLSYEPPTEHDALDYWVQDKPVKGTFPLSSRTPDDMIIWGQFSHFGGKNKIPARPFWNNFVSEQASEKMLDSFIRGMAPTYVVTKEPSEIIPLENGELLPEET